MQEERTYAIAYTTVDIVPIYRNKILMARKPNETKFRFVGGFVSPETDSNYAEAAVRELNEEVSGLGDYFSITPNNLIYIGNIKVNDPRPAYTRDKIYTNLFVINLHDHEQKLFYLEKNILKANDDIEELIWIDIATLKDKAIRKMCFMEVHLPLIEMLIEKYL